MRPGERENSVIVVEASLNASGRMALITVKAGIYIPSYPVMPLVGDRLCVCMTVDTAEGSVIVRCGMTLGAALPGTGMLSRIYREVLCVMHCKTGGFPAGNGRVAIGAACRDMGCCVVRVGGLVVGLCVACETIGGGSLESVHMALGAWCGDMRAGERKLPVIMIE